MPIKQLFVSSQVTSSGYHDSEDANDEAKVKGKAPAKRKEKKRFVHL